MSIVMASCAQWNNIEPLLPIVTFVVIMTRPHPAINTIQGVYTGQSSRTYGGIHRRLRSSLVVVPIRPFPSSVKTAFSLVFN